MSRYSGRGELRGSAFYWSDGDEDTAYEEHRQRIVDDETERERAKREALELAQYGIGSAI